MLKTLKTIIRSFTSFRMTLDEAGVIHLIPLFLLLAGIIAGVYLVQKEGFQIFKPKATSQNVEFLPGECLTSQDGFGVLKCPNVQIKFTSPIDTGQTSDAGFSLVKTAYAYHESGTEDYYCYDGDGVSNTSVGHSEKEPYGHNNYWDSCYKKNQTCVWLDKRGKSDDGTPFKNDAECVDRPICQSGRLISRDSKGGIHDFGECSLPLDQRTIRWFCGKDNKIYRKYWVDPTDLSKGIKEIQNGDDSDDNNNCNIRDRKCEEFFNENVPGGARDDARCAEQTPLACEKLWSQFSNQLAEVPPTGLDVAAGSKTYIYAKLLNNASPKDSDKIEFQSQYGKWEQDAKLNGNWIAPNTAGIYTLSVKINGVDQAKCAVNFTVKAAPAPVAAAQNPTSPASGAPLRGADGRVPVSQPAGGTNQPSCNGTTGSAGTVTAAQAQCVLNIRSDVLNFYKNNGWCSGEIDKPGIVNNWYSKLANAQDKEQVKNCFTTGGTGGGNGNAVPAGCKDDGPLGNVTPAQAKCVLDKRTDILPFYQKNNWCGDESNYPKIVNNWMSINSQTDKNEVKNCFEGASGNVTKTTARFRFADDYADLANAKWRDYTAANRTVNHTFKDTSPGTKSIFAEFEIVTKDTQGNVTKTETVQATPFPYSIKLIKEETPGNGTCPVTASCCASNLQKCGPGVAGSKFDGVSKDTACPIGYQWCYSGYCISENYDGKGTTGSCGGTTTGGSNTGGPLIANCSVVSRTTMPVNQPVTYHIFASGGAGNYKYYWAGDLGNSSSSNSELVKTYTTTGYKTGSVIVYSGNDSKNAPCPDVNVVGEDSSELSCQKDCLKCTAVKTCGYDTYDSCVDDKGNSKTSTRFCQNGATKFRCFANANYNCASNEKPNVYDYLCSACINNGSEDE